MFPRRRARHDLAVPHRRRFVGRPVKYYRRLRPETLEYRSLLAPFTPGDIIALRVGPGGSPTTAAAPVFLDEFDLSGSRVQTIQLPTTTVGNQHRLTLGGTAGTTEGMLIRSTNGQYLLLAGY